MVWDLFGIYLGSIWDLGASLGIGFEGGPCSVRLVVDATACHAVPVRKKPVCQIGCCYNHVFITQATIWPTVDGQINFTLCFQFHFYRSPSPPKLNVGTWLVKGLAEISNIELGGRGWGAYWQQWVERAFAKQECKINLSTNRRILPSCRNSYHDGKCGEEGVAQNIDLILCGRSTS